MQFHLKLKVWKIPGAWRVAGVSLQWKAEKAGV
jgi:hypothetical protein